ncbi:MAG: hypothetical protein KKD44_06475, partial [Proteobacteria bacterium]|nr:hypothetical protein [Pseudomonadota bacterium]
IEQAVNQYYIFGLSILFSFFFAYIAKRRKNNLSRTLFHPPLAGVVRDTKILKNKHETKRSV